MTKRFVRVSSGIGMTQETLKTTPLHALHVELGAKMVPFAGYDMPVQFALGVLGEHLHVREKAGLFDVSHMGQARLVGPDYATVAAALEALTPGEIQKLKPSRMRYTLLLGPDGGVLDDLMVTHPSDEDGVLMLVVNAACKEEDYAYIGERLPENVRLERIEDRALIALQGPQAAQVLARFAPDAAELKFMTAKRLSLAGVACDVSRSGYTGEDGYEISIPASEAEGFARALLAEAGVEPIGLGARDSLRLEAGLCLYGQDLTPEISPAEAALNWAIGKRRREAADFPGAARILKEMSAPTRLRVGVKPLTKAPARAGATLHDEAGEEVGVITSGGFGPSFGGPVAMGYVDAALAESGRALQISIRGKLTPGEVHDLPFTPQRYFKGS